MEFILLLWDELDDVSAACRHLTISTVDEIAEISGVIGAAVTAFAVWIARLPQ